MADNTTLNTGTGGDVIATDDVAGVKYQRVKLVDGTADSTAAIGGDATNGLDVDVTRVQGSVSVTDGGGSLTVDAPVGTPVFVRLSDGTSAIATLPVSVAALPALAAGNNNIGDVDVVTAPGTAADGAVGQPAVVYVLGGFDGSNVQSLITDSTGRLHVAAINSALPAGTNNIGDVDVLTLPAIPAGTNTIGNAGLVPTTTGGLTLSKTVSAASTNATSVKGTAGQVYSVQVFNTNAAARYLKLYNKATAPTVGSDTPVKTLTIPGNTAGAGLVLSWPQGLAFGTGIAFALTTGAADADTGAVAATELVVNVDYA